jgi:sulfonate transport system substrate-binding protein
MRGVKITGFWLFSAAALALAVPASGAHLGTRATPNPKLPTPTTIKMLKVPYFALEQIAADRGFFTKYNLNVDFVTQVVQGIAGIPAIVSNQVQTGQGFGVPTPILAMAGGAKLKIVFAGGLSDYGDYRMYTKVGSGINKPADMVGKTFGVVNLGAYPDLALQVWLFKNKVNLSQVKRVSVPLPSMCDALVRGQVDAAMMYSLYWKQCEAANGSQLKEWFKDSEVLPSAKLYEAYVFTEDYIKSNPAIVRAWVAGMKDASAFVKKNPNGAKDIIAKVTGISADLLIPQNQPPGNCVNPKAVAQWVTLMTNYGSIQRGSVDPKTIYTNQFNPGCAKILAQLNKPPAKKK